MKNTATGPDKVSASNLLMWHRESIASLYNIFLALEIMPATLSAARVTFIPKVEIPLVPSDFLSRALHKIIARRMRNCLEFSKLQWLSRGHHFAPLCITEGS